MTKYTYQNGDSGIKGKTLLVPLFTTKNLLKFQKSDQKTDELILVTACSSNHYWELLDAIDDIHTYAPHAKIIFYDLGLWFWQRIKVMSICNLEYNKLDFESLPEHVNYLYNYAWKLVIIAKELNRFNRFLWMDASVRFTCKNITNDLLKNPPDFELLMLEKAGHSNYAATHKAMYNYIPINLSLAQNVEMLGANFMWLSRKKDNKSVIKWALLCALDVNCIQPEGHYIFCNKEKDKIWMGCHRYDQSVVNLLLMNKYGDKTNLYALQTSCAKIDRRAVKTTLFHTPSQIKFCSI